LKDDVNIFKDFYKASLSEIGKKIIHEIVMNYFKLGMYVAPVKQMPGKPRSDIIVIPYVEGTLKLDFNRAIGIEIKAYPESHKDQVIINITKDTIDLFSEIHVWTLESKKEVIDKIVNNWIDKVTEDANNLIELRNKLLERVSIYTLNIENKAKNNMEEISNELSSEDTTTDTVTTATGTVSIYQTWN
jgi:hypothetical protein